MLTLHFFPCIRYLAWNISQNVAIGRQVLMKGKNCYTRAWGIAIFKFCSEEKEAVKESGKHTGNQEENHKSTQEQSHGNHGEGALRRKMWSGTLQKSLEQILFLQLSQLSFHLDRLLFRQWYHWGNSENAPETEIPVVLYN